MTAADRRALLGGWARDFAAVTAVGVFLGLLGPFGSFLNGPAWQRVPYWLLMAWLGFFVYGAVIRLILSRAPSRRAAWIALAGAAVLLSAPFGLISWWIAHAMWPALSSVPHLTPQLWCLEGLIITAPQVALFSIAIERRRRAAGEKRGPPSPGAGLLGAAPSEVLCLQMEDHYVRVHTAGGSRLVLATMAQAVAGLGRAQGLRVHRSWWVADKAVAGAAAEGRNLRLALTNGLSAPVARSAVAAVRAAGWLERRRVAQAG
jgi:hypothetical protein